MYDEINYCAIRKNQNCVIKSRLFFVAINYTNHVKNILVGIYKH